MSNQNLNKLFEERSRLLSDLSSLTHIVHGTIMERYTVCSRPDCKCHQGQKHGPVLCIVVNESGRQKQKYIPKIMHDSARLSIEEYKRALEIIDRISAINLKLLQEKEHE